MIDACNTFVHAYVIVHVNLVWTLPLSNVIHYFHSQVKVKYISMKINSLDRNPYNKVIGNKHS